MIRKDRTTEPRSVPGGPPFGRANLTRDGRRLLEERIQSLERTVEELHSALDESERSADTVESYHQAVRELEHLRELLTSAGTIENIPDDPRVVALGDTVTSGSTTAPRRLTSSSTRPRRRWRINAYPQRHRWEARCSPGRSGRRSKS